MSEKAMAPSGPATGNSGRAMSGVKMAMQIIPTRGGKCCMTCMLRTVNKMAK
jgi:hypothetical protein